MNKKYKRARKQQFHALLRLISFHSVKIIGSLRIIKHIAAYSGVLKRTYLGFYVGGGVLFVIAVA